VIEPPSLTGSDPNDLANPGINDPPRADGVLAESLPIDLAALDQAIEHCLGRIDAVGERLSELLASEGVWPWLAGTVIVAAAGAVAQSWVRRSRFDPLARAGGERSMSTWFLDSLSDA
jgi:hypothetical protein